MTFAELARCGRGPGYVVVDDLDARFGSLDAKWSIDRGRAPKTDPRGPSEQFRSCLADDDMPAADAEGETLAQLVAATER